MQQRHTLYILPCVLMHTTAFCKHADGRLKHSRLMYQPGYCSQTAEMARAYASKHCIDMRSNLVTVTGVSRYERIETPSHFAPWTDPEPVSKSILNFLKT